MKTKTLIVTSGWATRESGDKSNFYRVEQVTDSITPAPGEFLSPTDVDVYCNSKQWKVTIKPFPN